MPAPHPYAGAMTDETKPVCGHTYQTRERRVFSCTKQPHEHRPNEHYYQRDRAEEERRKMQPVARLTLVPGERR